MLATLFAAVSLLCARQTRHATANKDEDHKGREDTHVIASVVSFCVAVAQRFEMALGVLPADHSHKAINVTRGFGAEIHVVGVFVHIERQDR